MDPKSQMDLKHTEMQYLGAFEIFKETFKIINKNRKIFAIAALCFIHPLNYSLEGLMGTLIHVLSNLHEYGNTSHLFSHVWPFFWPFNVFLIIFFFGYSIFATAGLSHTVAAVYTGREPTPKETMTAITKVWKRVSVTFLCALLVVLAYHFIAGFAMFFIVWISSTTTTTLVVFLAFYFVGLFYLVLVLQLAGVVSALEESCGFKAMEKSRLLLKGKMVSATVVVFAVWSSFGILLWLDNVVRKMLFSPSLSVLTAAMYVPASISMLVLILVFLLGKLVLETMLYFVCKSYHLEDIDMSALSNQDHYMPITSSEC